MTFAEKFRAARIAAGLTQKETAALLWTTQSRISKWESGKCAPRALARPEIFRRLQRERKVR